MHFIEDWGQNEMSALYCNSSPSLTPCLIPFMPPTPPHPAPLSSPPPLHLLSTDVQCSWMNSSKSPFLSLPLLSLSLSTAWLCSSSSSLSFPQQWCVTEIMMAVTLHPSTKHSHIDMCMEKWNKPQHIYLYTHVHPHTCCWLCCVFALQANGHSFLHMEHETAVSLLKSFPRTVDLMVLRDSSTR